MLKILPIKDTLSLYRDYLYVVLILFIFLILTRIEVNKKTKGPRLVNEQTAKRREQG